MTTLSTKRCAFCEKVGKLSREHPFGKWARPYIRTNFTNTRHSFSQRHPESGRPVWRQTRIRDGHPLHQQIRTACATCNNGWMSRLQDRTSAIALPFVKGAFPFLPPPHRETLAAWAIMASMNIEYWNPETISVPQGHRAALMKTEKPIGGWYVGLGRYDGSLLDGVFYHRQMRLDAPHTAAHMSHAQSTVFALGKALFHTLSTSSEESFSLVVPSANAYGAAAGLRTIWPIDGPNLLAATSPIGDLGAAAIIEIFGDEPATF
jgi:hypothetical protein